jgi:hypothetical protein
MKRRVFFITLAFLFSVSIVLLPVQVYAQKNITVLNSSFERPDSGKVTGFDGKSTHVGAKTGIPILFWHVDSPDSSQFDSGVEKKATSDGQYDAFLMGGDSAIYQNLTRRMFDDDMLTLKVDARNSWKGTTLKMELFYLDGDSAKAPRVSMVSETKTLTNTMAPYSISINGSAVPLAVGHKIGILLDNVSPDSASWLELDNVRLTNDDPTIIEVANYSFEQPDSLKIEGWNGPGSCPKLGNSQVDIPAWTTDTVKVADSGLEQGWGAQDGQYTGFLMGSDTGVWNKTDYTILAGDILTLRVMARNNWAATVFHSELYYVDAQGQRVTLASSDDALNTDLTWAEYSVGVDVSTIPASVGKKLGVYLDNTSPTGSSWLGMDLVRINANHDVIPTTSVSQTQMNPGVFALTQNYPNPFNPSTSISYTLKNNGKIRLTVFDLLGREVAVLANEIQTAGQHEVKFSANSLSSGVYFYKLQAGNQVITKKMMLLK